MPCAVAIMKVCCNMALDAHGRGPSPACTVCNNNSHIWRHFSCVTFIHSRILCNFFLPSMQSVQSRPRANWKGREEGPMARHNAQSNLNPADIRDVLSVWPTGGGI